jgi:ankyrin repeat protein
VAASNGKFKSVKLLLDTQAVDINVRSISGRSPIFEAAAGGFEDIVELLLSGGANTGFRDGDGQTPLSIAIKNGRRKVVDVLNNWARSPPGLSDVGLL